MTPLEEVLSGRDERAACQKRMLASREGAFVCQIGLNVPGFPKRVPGDITIIKDCRRLGSAGRGPSTAKATTRARSSARPSKRRTAWRREESST